MAREEKSRGLRIGYRKASERINRAFTAAFSSLVLVAVSPLMLVIALFILILDGRPVLYSGWRLGKGKVLFRMYKFRTLVPEAQGRIGGDLFTPRLSSNRELLTKSGQFLRDTRLDELPQLVNVLRGDMDLLGPRPERPEVYEKLCKNIRGYDRRFTVKPGLIGYSQIFTPHSTPKRFRHLVDNKFLSLNHRYSIEVALVAGTLSMLFVRMLSKISRATGHALSNLVHRRKEKRALVRQDPRDAVVSICPQGAAGAAVEGALKDINEEALLVYTREPLAAGPFRLTIVAPVFNWHGRQMHKTISCTASIYSSAQTAQDSWRHRYVLTYTPASPLNGYLIHQHLLHGSIVHAWRRERRHGTRPHPSAPAPLRGTERRA